ncbi:PREDICTED: FK506-binding protein-like [Nanorana parkeri]|uniref:FK506-binding protein-like n=1 Tax=Nanorana parkeri TaxID=125878 RepID=UPI000854A3AA|nr:PREDICTED: FK506-binding protein-like [Nanorana parkeri]
MESPQASPGCATWRCPDGSFTKTILEPGSGVDKPKEHATCVTLLEHLADPPPEFCLSSGPGYSAGSWIEVELGEGDTAQDRLVDQCLETMLQGEVCQLDCPIGFQLVLRLKSFEGGTEAWELEPSEKIQRAIKDREKGGAAFRNGNIEGAERRYSRGLRLLVCTPGEAEEEKVALLSNLAACDLKKRRFREAEVRCTRILDMDPNHFKALYRRGVARAGMSDWEGARGDFDKLLKLDPGNKEAKRELASVREKEKIAQAQISKALGKMFL